MVEITKKYKIGTRRFGLINWVGAWTLYQKETLRFLNVWAQTLFSPLISSLLFLLVLSLAIGTERGDVLGVSFITFLAPGLISMQVIQQSFSHSSSSFMISKIQGNIVDLLYAPLSAAEVTIAVSLAAVTRAAIIAVISIKLSNGIKTWTCLSYSISYLYFDGLSARDAGDIFLSESRRQRYAVAFNFAWLRTN